MGSASRYSRISTPRLPSSEVRCSARLFDVGGQLVGREGSHGGRGLIESEYPFATRVGDQDPDRTSGGGLGGKEVDHAGNGHDVEQGRIE